MTLKKPKQIVVRGRFQQAPPYGRGGGKALHGCKMRVPLGAASAYRKAAQRWWGSAGVRDVFKA